MWKKIGVNTELKSQEFKVLIPTRVKKQYLMSRDGWNGDYVDPMTFLDQFMANTDQNNPGYNNSAYDAKVNEAKKEADNTKRFALMHEAEDMLMNDMPIIPVYTYTKTIGIKDYVKGCRVSLINTIYFKEAYIEGKK